MKETKILILNEFNEKLVGIKTIPSIQKNKYPAIILVHGFGATKEESEMFDNLAKNLSDEDFLIYRFDFSGCGESDGDYAETSLTKLKSDLSKILNFVQSQPDVDVSKIGMLGQSLGTTTIIALEPKIKCLAFTGSVLHAKEILIKLFNDGYNPNGISTRIKANGTISKVKPQFWKDFDNYKLLKSIKNIHCPILFIHGEQDEKTPISEMEAYFENANKPKEKIIIDGAFHSLKPHREKMYKIAVDWFKKYLIL